VNGTKPEHGFIHNNGFTKRTLRLNLKNLLKSKSFWENVFIVIFAVVLFIGLRLTIQDYEVTSSSMENTLQVNERVLVDKLAFKFGTPQRGDIIVFHPPFPSIAPFIKRVIGLPGEQVEIANGTVTVIKSDGSILILNEPYIKEPPNYNYTSIVIPANEYFVLGDNRTNSEDSHTGYLVSRSELIGKAWLDIWPLKLFGPAHNYSKYAAAAKTGN
jgi:signal peptidase I